MPSPISAALIGFGAVLTSVSAVAGSIVAGAGILVEAVVFYVSGSDAR
jgi:hypothetical protein